MIHIFKRILIILIIFNVVVTFILISIKNKFIVKNPIFGTAINAIINDDNQCDKLNTKSSNIYDYSGKSIIFNIYNIENEDYNNNINLIDNVIKERLNVNIVDIIYYSKKNLESVKDFVAKYSINRPVYYIERSFLKKKLLIDSNSVIISDFNINNVVKLKNADYIKLEENVRNLYKKTKKIKNEDDIKTTKISNDELLIKSISNLLPIKNDDYDELFFVDILGKKIFSVHADKNLNYYIGNGKNEEGPIEKVLFDNIKAVKLYKNNLYILDGIFIKKIDLKTNIASIILRDDTLNEIIDFDIINDNYFIFSTQTNKIVVYNDKNFSIINSNLGIINKILRYKDKIILSDITNSKLYIYRDNNIQEFIDINKVLGKNIKIKELTVSGDTLYILTSDSCLIIIENNNIIEQKSFKEIKNAKTIAASINDLYISDGTSIYKLSTKDLNNNNYNNKIIKLDFKFYYKSRNYFTLREFDFSSANSNLVWKNNILSIIINNNAYVDYEAPNYVDLYEINGNKLSYISENSILNDSIIFDKIDTDKSYYMNGKIYYRYNDMIFVKKINTFIKFKDNYINKNIEINFNNVYFNY